jgi:WS/DGAT/MGAT family acyltransferase
MERLSTLDAEFLSLEDGIAHMHIGAACVFAGPCPALEDVAALIGAKLHLIPRYRQRVRPVPMELGRPVWVDDPAFRLADHFHRVDLPPPGDDTAFCRLMAGIMSTPLDRSRPLWENWIVTGLEDGQWALVCKIHHSMVDGIAGVELLGAVLDLGPSIVVGDPLPWEPRPEPSGLAKESPGGSPTPRGSCAPRRERRRASPTSPGISEPRPPPCPSRGPSDRIAAGRTPRCGSTTCDPSVRRSAGRSTMSSSPP